MNVTAKKHARAQLLAVSLGAFGASSVAALAVPTPECVQRHAALATAAGFLEDAPTHVVLERSVNRARWAVDAPSGRAWIDAKSGDLVEIQFNVGD